MKALFLDDDFENNSFFETAKRTIELLNFFRNGKSHDDKSKEDYSDIDEDNEDDDDDFDIDEIR